MAALLAALKNAGIRTGILTDGRVEGQKAKLRALGLEDLADDILITDTLGGEAFRKPCDIAYRILARRWRLPFESVCYVGDNLSKDFHAPRVLGMRSLYFANLEGLYTEADEETDICTVRDTKALCDAVRKMCGLGET